jgi:glucose-6-phosphate dehydrogenase assembly protein OpcA
VSVAVQPERILHELADLWVSLGTEQSTGVLRACTMTLIVAVDNSADAAAAESTLAELMHEHPSRAIVLKLEESKKEMLEARVFAQCWMPFGGRQQICCEQVEIAASCDRLAGVTPVVLGIIVPDLPVVLWSRSARILEFPEFHQLFPLVHKLIVDSAQLGEPLEALQRVQALRSERRHVADLAWTRLTRWRELIANAFAEPGCRGRLRDAARITIFHAGANPPSAAYYLGAWLLPALSGPEKQTIEFRAAESGDDPVRGVEIAASAWKASFHLSDATATVDFDGAHSKVALDSLSEYNLLREELSILEKDPVFDRVLETAVQLAKSRPR